jgi:hypothetical protein
MKPPEAASRHFLPDLKRLPAKSVLEVAHDELPVFLRQYLFAPTWIVLAYGAFNVLVLAGLAYAGWQRREAGWEELLGGVGFGFFLTFFLAFSLHEALHLLGYKLLGAKKVALHFQQMMFLALCYDMAFGRRAFTFLAVLPFAVITPALLALLQLPLADFWHLALWGVLALHTAGCSGDFALVNYFHLNRHRRLFTYDEAGRSYFVEL